MTCRRGFGIILAIVVTLCVVLFIVAIAQLFFSGQVFSQAAHGAGGMTAEYLASSAVEEILHSLGHDLNDPASETFEEVRRALLLREPGTLDLSQRYKPAALLEAMKSSANRDFYKMYTLDSWSVKLPLRPLSDRETTQTLTVEAAFRLTIGRRSEYRRVTVERQIGITLAAPRRPLDQVPFAIVGTPFIADFRSLASRVDEAARAYERTRELLETWKSQVEGKPLGTPMTASLPPLAIGDSSSDAASVMLFADQQYVFGEGWESFPEPRLAEGLPADDSVIFAPASEEVELGDFQYYARLERKLGPLKRRLDGLLAGFPDTMAPLTQAASTGSLDSSAHAEWAEKMRRLGKDLREILEQMAEEARAIGEHLKAHTGPGATTERIDVMRHYKSELEILPLAYHVPGIAAARAFVSTPGLEAWPAVAGHVAVYEPEGPGEEKAIFATTVPFRGLAIVSRPSGLDLPVGEVKLDDPARDVLVLGADRVVLTASPVEAAIFVRKQLETTSDVRITGSVILLRYPKPPEGESEKPWTGKVSYNPALATGVIKGPKDISGLKLERYAVSLSPRTSARRVSWQP